MDKSFNKIIKSQIKLMVLSVIAVVLVCASASYALFSTSHKNTKDQIISIGTIATGISGTPINLVDIYPMEESELTNDYPTYSFTITNANGVNNYDVNYELYLTDNTGTLLSGPDASSYSNYTALLTSEYQYINYKLDDNTASNLGAVYDSTTGKIVIQTGELLRNKSEEHTIRFWLSTSAPKSVQGKVLSLVMNLTSTPKKDNYICSSANSKFKFLDEEGNTLTCTNLEVGTRIAIGDGETQQVFRYIRTTNTSDTTHTYNECQDGGDASIACTDADSRHPLANNQLRLLAEYNLNVGAIYEGGSGNKISDVDTTSATYGLQDSTVRGWVGDTVNIVGTIAYGVSNNNYSQSNVKTYTENYANYLNTTYFGGSSEVSGSAITYEELVMLGCNRDGGSGACSGAPNWVYTTTYWSGSPSTDTNVWGVDLNAYLGGGCSYINVNGYGVRAVISISASSI